MTLAKKKSPLTREKIRAKALELIDAHGLEDFSTRKLGAALGCEAMAIYWHYPSKDALLDAVVEEIVAPLGRAATAGDDWVSALRKVAHAYRGLSKQHPRAFPLVATRRFTTEGTYAFLESLFAIARAQGIEDRMAARYYRAVSAYCNGIALNELAALAEDKDPNALELRARYERVDAVSRWLGPDRFDDLFEFGLEVLLSSLSRAPRRV